MKVWGLVLFLALNGGCYGEKMKVLPNGAFQLGTVEARRFILCQSTNEGTFDCTIYFEDQSIEDEGRFALFPKKAVSLKDLKFESWDGIFVGTNQGQLVPFGVHRIDLGNGKTTKRKEFLRSPQEVWSTHWTSEQVIGRTSK